MSAKLALNRYYQRQLKKNKPRTSNEPRKAPEKETEKDVMQWCQKRGFDVSVVESKAVYSKSANRYLRGQTEAGFSDIAGCTDEGVGFFVELKAKGRVNTIRPAQVDFLTRKIRHGAFACCCDSADMLNNIYTNWSVIRKESYKKAQDYLMSVLPKSKPEEENELKW